MEVDLKLGAADWELSTELLLTKLSIVCIIWARHNALIMNTFSDGSFLQKKKTLVSGWCVKVPKVRRKMNYLFQSAASSVSTVLREAPTFASKRANVSEGLYVLPVACPRVFICVVCALVAYAFIVV